MGALVTQTLRFGVLGPLAVSRDGEELRLGGERQRALLAVLLLHANELVATERLVDQLFGEEPSEGTLNALYVAVSRLRRLVGGDQGAGVLVKRPGGYVLVTKPGELDVELFEGLVAEGRRLRAAGDSESAAARLRDALALWRGPPFADVASLEFVQAEIRRLEERRLVAEMERVDADLALGRDAELIGELELLVATNPLRERLRAQLMTALYRAGRQTEALEVYRDISERLRSELGLEPSGALQGLERAILTQDSSLEPAPREAVRPESIVCPFKGLASFDRGDADYFFGRERMVSDLIARLVSSSLVGIVGPSGIGKSSLLRAGVLPALSGGALPGSGSWRQVLVRPGSHPAAELSRALGARAPEDVLGALRPGERLVIAVDQLEELFTVCDDEAERAAWFDALAAAAGDAVGRPLVIVALRADFYGRVASYPRFARLLSHSHVLVGPMDRGELARAIEQPAARAGLDVERTLVDALVHDIAGEPGGLPLLSTTLLELWRERDGGALRYERYRRSGGVHGAVARLAEDAYSGFSDSDQTIARKLLLRLASGTDSALVRRRVAIAELGRVDGASGVLAALTDARLLTISEGEVEVSHETLIREWPRYRAWLEEDRAGRRVHEHLGASAREWEVRGGESADLYRGARLAAALDWAAQHADELSPIERQFLAASRRRAGREARRLRVILAGVAALLAVSIVAGIVALAQQRTARSEARVALARELGAEAVDAPRIDVAMLLAREAVTLDRSAQTESTLLATLLRSPAVIGTIALPGGTTGALAVSPDGRTLAVSDGLRELRLFDTHTHALIAPTEGDAFADRPAAYSSDGSLLAYRSSECSCTGFIVVRDTRTHQLVANLQLPGGSPPAPSDSPGGSIAIAPDDHKLYYAYWLLSSTGAPAAAFLQTWTLPNGGAHAPVPIGSGPLLAMRLINGGSQLMLVDTSSVQVLDARSLRVRHTVAITPAPVAPVAAAISPNGHIVAIGSQSGSVSFVDTSTGIARTGSKAHGDQVASVLYSADGRSVVTVGNDDTVIVWDPGAARPTQVLAGPPGQVAGAAISPDGSTLYTSSLEGVLLEWDLTGGRRFGNSYPTGATPACCDSVSPRAPPFALSPDGSMFAVRVAPSTVRLFSSRTRKGLAAFALTPNGNVITALAWSPNGHELAVAGHSGLVQLWSTDGTPRLRHTLAGLTPPFGRADAIQSVAFSPDGRLVAASDEATTGSSGVIPTGDYASLAIWEAATGRLLASPSGLNSNPVNGVARSGEDLVTFSPDGKLLALSLLDQSILILNSSTARLTQVLPSDAGTTALAFTPDGTLAVGTLAGTIELWNPISAKELAPPLVVAAAPVTSIAFDPSGRRFATAGLAEGTVKLWYTSTLAQPSLTMSTDPRSTSSLAFERDGTKLLAVDDAGSAYTWPMSLSTWEHDACAVAGRNLTSQEWSQLVTGQPYAAICP